jgi:hypothetical protein
VHDNKAQVEARFSPFEDSANLDARSLHGLHRTCHRLRNSFWMHLIELLGDMGLVESRFDPFGDSVSVGASSVQGLRQTNHRLRNR